MTCEAFQPMTFSHTFWTSAPSGPNKNTQKLATGHCDQDNTPSIMFSRADMNKEGARVLATPLSTIHSTTICSGFLYLGSSLSLAAAVPAWEEGGGV